MLIQCPNRGALAAFVLTLSACGGGDSGDSASLSLSQSTPNAGASNVNPDSGSLNLSFQVHGFDEPRLHWNLQCGSNFFMTVGGDNIAAVNEKMALALAYDGLPPNTACALSGQLEATNSTGANTLNWSLNFTTGATSVQRFPTSVVGVLGDRPFVMAIAQPHAIRRAPPQYLPGTNLRPPPTAWGLGTALTASGRVPVALWGHSACGPLVARMRFDPVAAQWATDAVHDPFQAGHAFEGNGCGSVSALGPGWLADAGGSGPAPTAKARSWTGDGSGGWFLVENDTPDTLQQRSAAGVQTVVARSSGGEQFGVLRTFSN